MASRGWCAAPTLDELREMRLKAEADAAKAEAEAGANELRLEILKRAAELEQARRERASDERDAVKLEMDELRTRMEYNAKVRGWALRHFNSGVNKPAGAEQGPQLQHYQRARDQARRLFLDFPERAGGQIQRGSALNFFLTTCGEAAVEHVALLADAERTMASLKEQLEQAKQAGDNKQQAELDEKISICRDRVELLQKLGGMQPLDPALLKLIRCAQGVTGPKLVISIEDGPLPLHWPALIRSDERYKVYREGIQALRDAALADLKKDGEVNKENVANLAEAVDDLYDEFTRDKQENWLKGPSRGPAVSAAYLDANRFVQELRNGVWRLAVARSHDEFPTKKFQGTTAPQLLAFLSRHGLSFSQSDQRSEAAYLAVFRTLSSYYSDLYSLELIQASEGRRASMLEEREKELRSIVDSSPLTGVAGLQFLELLREAIEALDN